MQRVFVAGGTGVLGRRVVPLLVEAGHAVTANVRDAVSRRRVEAAGARAVTVDVMDPVRTCALAADHDAIVNIATSIPTGMSAVRASGWSTNDALRAVASTNLAAAMASNQGRYVGESTTFPYTDGGDGWIGEAHPTSYFWGNETCRNAEAAAASVTKAGGIGVALRFAMFFADDSAHVRTICSAAHRGWYILNSRSDARVSFIHVDDAAAAVAAALSAPAGLYNVAEADPAPTSAHADALARSVRRRRLRLLPGLAVRLGGASVESLVRSQRVSSATLTAQSGWRPRRSVVDAWSEVPTAS